MNNDMNDKLGNNQEEPKLNLSGRDNIGSEVPLGEPVTTPRKKKSFGFGKSKAKSKTKVKQPNAKKANAKAGANAKSPKDKKASKSATALKVILAVLFFSVVALGAVWFVMTQTDTKPAETPVIIDTSSSKVEPQVKPLENQPTTAVPEVKPLADGEQQPAGTNPTDANANQVATVDQANTPLPTTENKATVAEVSKPSAPASTKPVDLNVPDPEKILNAEVPEDESLLKEEIDKLEDEEQRLEQQEKLLDKRLKMMDELTTKKQEQIELLEKQIAQLEESQKTGK